MEAIIAIVVLVAVVIGYMLKLQWDEVRRNIW